MSCQGRHRKRRVRGRFRVSVAEWNCAKGYWRVCGTHLRVLPQKGGPWRVVAE